MSKRNPLQPEQVYQDVEPEYDDSDFFPGTVPSVYFARGPGRKIAEDALEDVEEIRLAIELRDRLERFMGTACRKQPEIPQLFYVLLDCLMEPDHQERLKHLGAEFIAQGVL